MKIVAFDQEPVLLDRFIAAEADLYRGDPIHARVPARDLRPLLSPAAGFMRRGGRFRAFLSLAAGDEVRGRVAAMVSPALRDDDGRPLGLIGLWECADDATAARALLDAALAWLREQHVSRAVGPLDFSTWHRYRFVTEGHAHGPFLLDLHHHPWYAAQFEAAGFTPWRAYATLRAPHVPVAALARAHTRALAAGVRFEPMDAVDPASRLRLVWEMSRRLFAGKTAYAEIDWEEFERISAGGQALIVPGLSWFAWSGERPVGFLFAYPDLLEPLRTRDPSAKVQTTVLKTLAVDPDAVPGLGWALVHLHMDRALAQGYAWGLYALMEKWEPLLRFARHERRMLGRGRGEVWKRYALFSRAV